MLEDLIREAGLTPPYVSIIIPVYNVEEYLRRALDSLVYQKLDEIEIIPVNDQSPDNSQAILEEYARNFPGKVFPVMHETNQGPSAARWTGVKKARAPYIMFCDGDDFFDASACSLALEIALSGKHDMVGFNALRIDDESRQNKAYRKPRGRGYSALIRFAQTAFWNFFYKRDLLMDESLFIPKYFEDAAVMPRLMAMAKNPGWVPYSYQYCWCVRENSTMATFFSDKKMQDCLDADTYLWSYSDGPYKQDYAYRIACRMERYYRKYPSMFSASVRHIQRLYPEVKPFLPDNFPEDVFQRLEKIMAIPTDHLIPKRLYLNGFGAAHRNMETYVASVAEKGLSVERFILDESNCDVKAAPESVRLAYEQGNYEEAAAYFAMVRIGQEGGMYAAPGSYVTANADSLCCDQAFFCVGAEQTVSLHFFGGAAGNRWMQRIIDQVTSPRQLTLQEAICDILLTEGTVHLMGEEEYALNGLHILPALRSVHRRSNSWCYVNCSEKENMVTIPHNLYMETMKEISALYQQLDEKEQAEKKAMKEANAELNGKNREIEHLKRQLSHPLYALRARIVEHLPEPVADALRALKQKIFSK